MHQRRDRLSAPRLPLEKRPLDELSHKALRHRPPNDEPRVEIKKNDQVHPPFRSPDVGDVRSPDRIHARYLEVARQDVFGDRQAVARGGRPLGLLDSLGCDAMLFHQSRHPLATDSFAVSPQLAVNLGRAVVATALGMRRLDPLGQPLVLFLSLGWLMSAPSVVARRTDLKRTTHRREAELLPVDRA